ncbi:MAG: hypothetical protein K6G63_06020 [Eubacterium sp.]|nr:hypothetical protein [Eubacterium sp.]
MGIYGIDSGTSYVSYNGLGANSPAEPDKTKPVDQGALPNESSIEGSPSTNATSGDKKVGKEECQTCKERKYVDGSNEGDVSFKTPGHIDPNVSGAVVMGHEQEHVANARQEATKENKELISSSVSLHTAVCPECGRIYVAGGVTRTQMKTTIGDSNANKFNQNISNIKKNSLMGNNFDHGI